ncbi:uncharacterized protein LOC132062413 [Lycium ferocissimum]|uniref:uncharacterized protein LOC132062413 n=1 Tax=Lycium ferocissimum TaxID=112874 RepID=UPI0028153EB5|nr:uncharacterized protein LOC132062413 [Lycium ferocissimum]
MIECTKIRPGHGDFQWIQQFGHVEAEYLNPSVSDHSPILVKCGQQVHLHPRPFRFYPNVMEHPGFHDTLLAVWQQGNGSHTMVSIWRKLKEMKVQLKHINAYMASYSQKLRLAREKLEIIQGQLQDNLECTVLIEEERKLLQEIEKWSMVEEQVLRHKARATWIECGDSNSKYFHAQWKIRTSQNTISSIYTDAGTKLSDPVLIEQEFISVFSGLMGDCAAELPCLNIEVVRAGKCLTIQQQRALIQENWDTIKEDVFDDDKTSSMQLENLPL